MPESAPGLQDHHTVYTRQIRHDAQSADFLAISTPTEGGLNLSRRLNLAVGVLSCAPPVHGAQFWTKKSVADGAVWPRTLSSLLLVLLRQPSAGGAAAL